MYNVLKITHILDIIPSFAFGVYKRKSSNSSLILSYHLQEVRLSGIQTSMCCVQQYNNK
jgi:hypothetical protein